MKEYGGHEEYAEPEDHGDEKIIITTGETVTDFKFVSLVYDGSNSAVLEETVLFSMGELTPETPFVVTWREIGAAPIEESPLLMGVAIPLRLPLQEAEEVGI